MTANQVFDALANVFKECVRGDEALWSFREEIYDMEGFGLEYFAHATYGSNFVDMDLTDLLGRVAKLGAVSRLKFWSEGIDFGDGYTKITTPTLGVGVQIDEYRCHIFIYAKAAELPGGTRAQAADALST